MVEDNAQVQAFGAELLQDLGCDVRCAASGDEALDVLPEFKPDAVLTDIVMPGMSGVDLAEQIAAAYPSLPVILATGYSEQAAQGIRRWPVVLKPYSGTDLAAAITGAMRRSRAASET